MATYEVMFLDFYNVLDSEKRLGLISKLRTLASVEHDELTDMQLSSILWNSAAVFNPNISSWDEIESLHEFGMLLWSAMAVSDERMMASARYFPIDSRVGKTDPSVRVKNNISIKQALRQQFEDYLNDNGIALGDPGILQSELVRRDMLTDTLVPGDTQSFPPKITLALSAKTTTSVDLKWTFKRISDFYQYTVFYDTSPNIEDITRKSEIANTGAREDATVVAEILDQWDTALRITDLTAGTVYWFIVGLTDLNGRVTFSNELTVDLGA